MADLNEKQRRFVAEYLVDLNATQAAIRAGYSEKTAHSQGPRLLEHVGIQAAIAAANQKRQHRTEITQDRVLQELARLGFSDLRRIFAEDGRLLRPEEWPDDVAASVASIEVVTRSVGEGDVEHVAKVKLWDKPKAIEMIGRHLAMFTDKLEVDVTDGMAERLKRGRERARST